ncbi:MAG: hypothetical protein ABJD07_14765 [Gemmatimonadaceae bacterium]
MAELQRREVRALIDLAEVARGTFDYLLTLADDLLEEDPALSVRCLYRANKLADAANRALRTLEPSQRALIPSLIERDHLEMNPAIPPA